MRSTGEVMGIDGDFPISYAKAQLGAGMRIPTEGTALLSIKESDKPGVVQVAEQLHQMGFAIMATGGTRDFLSNYGIPAAHVKKVREGRPHL